MKKLFLIFSLLILTVLLSGCSLLKDTPFEGLAKVIAKPFNSIFGEHPERNLKNFLEVMGEKNYEKAFSYISESAKKVYPEQNLKNLEVGTGFTVNLAEITDKNKALVYYRYKESKNYSGQVAEMVKENGRWKVQSFGDDEHDRFDN